MFFRLVKELAEREKITEQLKAENPMQWIQKMNNIQNIANLFSYLEKTGMNDWLLYFFNGLIWGMWHITYYMFFLPDEHFTQISRPMMVVVGIVVMIFWSPMFVELRRLTNSVWPCVIAHSMEDAVPTMLFVTAGVLQIKQEYFGMLDTTRGVVPTVLVFLIGLGLRKFRMKQEQTACVK